MIDRYINKEFDPLVTKYELGKINVVWKHIVSNEDWR